MFKNELTNEQKNKIEKNIQHLDYLEGTGVLNSIRKKLVDEFFIFIGVGGNGKKSLVELKKALKNQVEASDIANQVMCLAVDTDWKELDLYVEKGDLLPGEVLKIPYEGAHESINPAKALPQMHTWLHRYLWEITGGAAADITPPPEMGGEGAGAIRQCGRVLFAQSAAQDALYKHLDSVKAKLAKMGTPKIKVFFLAGIAGGTGSGTIVDLAYLCRHHLKNILGSAYRRVSFSAYLSLPSACGNVTDPTDASVGNQNAYAALKEIDNFMTLSNRGESFKMDYGTPTVKEVDIAENIFDFCTLVEGVGNGGHFFDNNAETARKIVADSILNIICADKSNIVGTANVFMVDSFLSNQNARVTGKIEANSDNLWPRDTNYIYSVIGFSSCVVPVDLLTIYVAKKIFDEVFSRFRKAELATEDRATEFLEACGLGFGTVGNAWKTLQKKDLLKDIQAQADAEFKANGPYYMVNLTKEAANLLENAPDDYIHKARHNKTKFMANQDKWNRVESIYNAALTYIRQMNTSLYDVYTYSIEVLKQLIENNAKILTDTNEYKSTFGRTFQWSPIDLRSGDQATKAVTRYLDNIMSPADVKKTATKFVDMLCEKKDEWTGLDTDSAHGVMTYNVAEEIRKFIAENLKECISTTLEEFLVKAYSGKENAPVFEYDNQNNQVYSKDTAHAASQILTRLDANASPLAEITGINLANTYSNVYLTVPEECKWLYQAMVDRAPGSGIDPNYIFKSTAKDRVVLCRLYTGVPAWAFFWTKGAEEEYEKVSPNKVGLHIEQGEGGNNWGELPNLYPEKLWDVSDRSKREREENLSKNVKTWMKEAKGLDLLTPNLREKDYMNLALLAGTYTAEELLEKAELSESQKYSLRELIDILVSKGYLEEEKVQYVNMVMTTPDKFTAEEFEEYRFNMACRIMRRLHGKWDSLQETISVVKELNERNEKRVIVKKIDNSFVDTFANALAWELITYDGRRGYWKNCLDDETRMGDKLEKKIQKQCAHYYGYQSFAGLHADMLEEFKNRISELEDEADDDALDRVDDVKKSMKDSLKALRNAKKKDAAPWDEKSPFAKDGNESECPMATESFMESVGNDTLGENIRKFYDTFIANI